MRLNFINPKKESGPHQIGDVFYNNFSKEYLIILCFDCEYLLSINSLNSNILTDNVVYLRIDQEDGYRGVGFSQKEYLSGDQHSYFGKADLNNLLIDVVKDNV